MDYHRGARRSVRRRFSGRAEQVCQARGLVDELLPAASPEFEVARLLLGEAATNALLHSASGEDGGSFEVACELAHQRLRVEVRDGGAPSGPRRRLHLPDSLTGRGLELFDALASRWGSSGDRDGHLVWFELDLGPG